jgi:LAO/AO transport system kinase
MTGSLVDRILARDPRAIARAISKIENNAPDANEILKALFAHTGRGLTVGVTGAPGAGKSSLVDKLALHYRSIAMTVGVIAVDPSSPFSGGAILGDRIRMQTLANDPGVFIRSMATRGNLGGLSRATVDAVAVLEAAGYDRTLVETVGVGQDEVDIVKAADVSVVVLVPGMGDDIQAIKAGIMEIGDIFVINKSDREGVERTERELITLLQMSEQPDEKDGWRPPIVRTVATQNKGIAEFVEAIENFAEFRRGRLASIDKRANVAQNRIIELLRERLLRRALDEALAPGELTELAAQVASRSRDPYSIVDEIAGRIRMSNPSETIIQHLGVAVESIDEALAFWRDALGLELKGVEVVEDQGVRVAMLPIGESRIELLEATGEETPVGKFLAKRGPGIHHLCVEVNDINAKLAELKIRGARLIDERPRIGAGGALVAFIHPSSTGGVLIELTQKGSGSH